MKSRWIHYSTAELDWLQQRSTMPRRQLHTAFASKFSRDDVSVANIKSLCTRNSWTTGRTGQFEPGQTPPNKGKKMPFNANSARTQFKKGHRGGKASQLYKPVGTERHSKDGYVERKIHDGMPLQSRWRAVHLLNWEQKHGSLPDGHCLKCIDGDKSNTATTNWMAIPRALLPRLNGRWTLLNYDNAEPELRPYILAAAKLKHAARESAKSSTKQKEARNGKHGTTTHRD